MDEKDYKKLKDGWLSAPIPEDEEDRLDILYKYRILDTQPSKNFDRITKLLSHYLETDFALVSLVDKDRQWFKSAHGIDAVETPRDQAFCAHAILDDDPFIVPDAAEDERFRSNPLVEDGPGIRFYAGMPLRNKDGFRLGTLCAIDTKPREDFLAEHRLLIKTLADIVVDEIELHFANIKLKQQSDSMKNLLAEWISRIIQFSHNTKQNLNKIRSYELNEELKERIDSIEAGVDNMLENTIKTNNKS